MNNLTLVLTNCSFQFRTIVYVYLVFQERRTICAFLKCFKKLKLVILKEIKNLCNNIFTMKVAVPGKFCLAHCVSFRCIEPHR